MTHRKRRTAGYRKDGGVDLRRLPRIVECPLGRQRAYGFAGQRLHGRAGEPESPPDFDGQPTIWLDNRLTGKLELEVAIHEALHLACPWMFEDVVTPVARYVSRVLWKLGFRRAP